MAKSFDVFLSHNSKDKPAVRELALALRARGIRVWLDEWELVPGRPWLEALETIIETIGCATILVGKDGLGPWELPEVRACLGEFVRRGLPVIPVLLPGAPEKPALPLLLRQFTWVDLRSGLTEEGLKSLQWGITGNLPEAAAESVSITSESSEGKEELRHPFIEPLTGIRFLWIPGGRFFMGGKAHSDERPAHWVRISPFWLGEVPVTTRQFGMLVEKMGYRERGLWRERRLSAPDQPMVNLNWEQAYTFCLWLAEVSRRQIMLPTEAQWEFAARAFDGREYPWGNEPPDGTKAHFGLNSFREHHLPFPVGSFPAGRGPFGTLDQAGNVWEWCLDAADAKAYERRVKGDGPINPVIEAPSGYEGSRIVRGGSLISPPEQLRAAYRSSYPSMFGGDNIGFRVAAATAPTSFPSHFPTNLREVKGAHPTYITPLGWD